AAAHAPKPSSPPPPKLTTTRPLTILFVWELGSGLGHLMQILALAEELARRGHRVFVAVRDLMAAAPVFEGKGLHFLPAPHKEGGGPVVFRRTLSFAYLLSNVGWHS